MRGGLFQKTMISAGALALVTLAACERREDRGATTGMAGRDTTPAVPADTGPAAPGAPTDLTDANIVALLDEANQADSASGAFALTKATNPDVRAFAKLMMSEHHALRVQGQQLAKKLNVTPQPPANDPVQPLAQQEMAALRSAPKGQEFDRTYIEQEITVHKAVLDLAKQAHDDTDNEQLKALIKKAQPVIEKHLDRAEEIQKKLGERAA